jgi:serine protease Do
VNLRGEVIGINTAIHSRSGGNNGIGFAIPANLAKWVAEQLLEKGGVNRAYLGIAMQSLNPKLAEHLNVGPREGVVVTEVIPGSPADQAGIQIGDVITHLGSQAIKSPKDLQLAVEQSAFGSENSIQMVRNQKPIEVTYVAQPNPNQNQTLSELSDSYTKPKSDKLLGMNLSAKAEHSDANSEVVGLRVISVEADGNAAQAGISNGTLLIEANHITLDSIDVLHRIFDSATQKGDQSILVLAENNGIRKFVVIPIA